MSDKPTGVPDWRQRRDETGKLGLPLQPNGVPVTTDRSQARAMSEKDAVRTVESMYGSLEEFGSWCIVEAPMMLDPDASLVKKAELSRLPANALLTLLARSTKFRAALRSVLANQSFGITEEIKHLQAVASIAKNEGRTVMAKSGEPIKVDNSEKGIMDAGEYLNRYRGTPLEGNSGGGNTLILNFGGIPEVESQDDRTVTVENRGLRPHSPLRAGGLPPQGARSRYETLGDGSESRGEARIDPAVVGGDLDFGSPEAPGAPDYFGKSPERPVERRSARPDPASRAERLRNHGRRDPKLPN